MKHSEKIVEWRKGPKANKSIPKYFECLTCFENSGSWSGTVFTCINGHESRLEDA